MLLLLIIIAYLHFDEKISNFFGNCQKGYAKMVKTTKAKVRHRVVRTQKSAKARVMTKLKMIRGDNTVHIDTYYSIFCKLCAAKGSLKGLNFCHRYRRLVVV